MNFKGTISNRVTIAIAIAILPVIAVVVAMEWWEALFIPVGLFAVWMTLYRIDWAMWFVVIATPVSVSLTDLTGGAGLSIPTEPMLVLITALTLVKMMFFKEYDKRLIRHPISIAIYLYLIWMFLTVLPRNFPWYQ